MMMGIRPGVRRYGAAALAALVCIVSGCGSSASRADQAAAKGPPVTIDARKLPGVGMVLVNKHGYALYMFQPDDQRLVTCSNLCAATWPPVKISPSARLVAGSGVRASLLGTDPDPGGGHVVTYAGWPLYTYTGDVQPGQHTGQGIDLNGGPWFLMRPTGKPLTLGLGS